MSKGRTCTVLTIALAAATSTLPAAAAGYSEFSAFVRERPPAPRRAPVDRLEWEVRTWTPARAGPELLRAPDAALLDAARNRRWSEALDLLTSGKADANARDELGTCALVLAAHAGQDEVVRELLRRRADVDRSGADGFTPLGAAAFRGHRSTLRALLKAGADPTRSGATGQTPLHLAAMTGRVDIIDELLRAGVDPYVRNRAGDSALDVAANRGQQDAMRRLIDASVGSTTSGRKRLERRPSRSTFLLP